jgi:hypothetical protein
VTGIVHTFYKYLDVGFYCGRESLQVGEELTQSHNMVIKLWTSLVSKYCTCSITREEGEKGCIPIATSQVLL